MRQLFTRTVMSIALLAVASGASAQAVKFDLITTFENVGNGLPGEAAQGPDGAFYAVSIFSDSSTVAFFRIDPVAHTQTVVATFDMGQDNPGASRLVLAADRRFYASFVADQGGGIVRFDPLTNTAAIVREFRIDPDTNFPGLDGTFPGPLTKGRDGLLYGAMSLSSPDVDPGQSGSLFKFDPASGAFERLHDFHFDEGGFSPSAALVEGADGVWYGSDIDVDTFCGLAFKFDTHTSLLAPLHTFDMNVDGCSPGALGVLPSGLLIGVTTSGNADGISPDGTTGAVFTIDPATGASSVVRSFFAADGFNPINPGNITVTPGGSAYILAQNFGAGIASVLRVRPESGAIEVIQDFVGPGPEIGALTIGSDARLHGIYDGFQFFSLGVLDPVPVAPAGGAVGGTTTLSATLKALGMPLAGRVVSFTVNGVSKGSALTNLNGVATLDNVSLAGLAAGTFPDAIGASFAGDLLFPATSGSGLLNVLAGVTPGMMVGDGYVAEDLVRYDFKFVVQENVVGKDRGKLELRISDVDDGHKKKVKRNDRFLSTSYTDVVFTLDSALRPQFDNVAFAGTGTWNGVSGYRFVALAQDRLGPSRHRESLQIVIYNSANQVVASVDGIVKGGSLESRRIHRH